MIAKPLEICELVVPSAILCKIPILLEFYNFIDVWVVIYLLRTCWKYIILHYFDFE